jgi:hypothetical protein
VQELLPFSVKNMNTKKIINKVGVSLLGIPVMIQSGYALDKNRTANGARSVAPSGRPLTQQEQANFDLRKAAATGDLQMAQDALRRGAQINDPGPHSGLMALDYAQRKGDRAMIDLLIRNGAHPVAPPNHPVAPSGRPLTQQEQANFDLRKAAATGDLQMVQDALRRGAQINDPGPHSGLTALDYAQMSGNRAMIDLLIRNGAHPVAQ